LGVKYGPMRGEFLFRFWASIAALALCGVALAIKGVQINMVAVEPGVIAFAFLGGSAAPAAWHLWVCKDR